jgi:hypothetical protein
LLARKIFKLNEPFREITSDDTKKPFRNEFLEKAGITLTAFVKENHDDKYVWVYDFDGKILAVLSFLDTGSCFYMDVLGKNRLHDDISDDLKPGFSLVRLLEDLSPKFGYAMIKLESTSNRVEYWKSQGYKITGTPSLSAKFGQLFSMEKRLS